MIFNFLKKYFSKTNEKLDNILSFKLDNSNIPSFNITVNDTSYDAAKKLALFIYFLNSGFFQKEMFDILINKSNEDIDIKYFLKDVVLHWIDYKKNYADNEPIISPTDFFKRA